MNSTFESVGRITGVIVRMNAHMGGVEIAFPVKPDSQTLDAVKASGFRWSSRAKVWYAKYSEETWAKAHNIAGLPLPTIVKAS